MKKVQHHAHEILLGTSYLAFQNLTFLADLLQDW